MISVQEMEMMVKASRPEFGSSSKKYDPVKAEFSREALHNELERKQRRAEAFQKAKRTVRVWFRSFRAQNAASV